MTEVEKYLPEAFAKMWPISAKGFEKPEQISAGAAPVLQWLAIADLIVDPAYHRPIVGKGRRKVNRIARSFSWSCFTPVIVTPRESGKFVIIDGQHRTTAAALVGFDSVPCQIVVADRDAQAAAHNAINDVSQPASRMALHAAALSASEEWAVQLAEICARAEVELLRYPVPVDRQSAGQTMAIGAVAQCFKRYGEATLITALQCVTQTTNNQPGALSARMIKALCAVLDGNKECRDSGLALLEAFDAIDLLALQSTATAAAVRLESNPVQVLADAIRAELRAQVAGRRPPPNAVYGRQNSEDKRMPTEFRSRLTKRVRELPPSRT
jgi:hypothetical protein